MRQMRTNPRHPECHGPTSCHLASLANPLHGFPFMVLEAVLDT